MSYGEKMETEMKETERNCTCDHDKKYHGRDGCVYPYVQYPNGIEDGCDCTAPGCADGHDLTTGTCPVCGITWNEIDEVK